MAGEIESYRLPNLNGATLKELQATEFLQRLLDRGNNVLLKCGPIVRESRDRVPKELDWHVRRYAPDDEFTWKDLIVIELQNANFGN